MYDQIAASCLPALAREAREQAGNSALQFYAQISVFNWRGELCEPVLDAAVAEEGYCGKSHCKYRTGEYPQTMRTRLICVGMQKPWCGG